MTISSTDNRSGPYTLNGVTTAFDYDFKIVDRTHVQVIRTNLAGVESALAIDADYTVTGVGVAEGGQIVTTSALSNGTITLLLNVPFLQETDLENQGAYNAEDVEAAFDLSVQRDLQLKEELDRAVKVSASSTLTADELIVDLLEASADAVSAASAAQLAATNAEAEAAASAASASAAAASAGLVDTAAVAYALTAARLYQHGRLGGL